MKKITAVLAALTLISCVSCGEEETSSSSEVSESSISETETIDTTTTAEDEEITDTTTTAEEEETTTVVDAEETTDGEEGETEDITDYSDETISVMDNFITSSNGDSVYDCNGIDIIYRVVNNSIVSDDIRTVVLSTVFDESVEDFDTLDYSDFMSISYDDIEYQTSGIIDKSDEPVASFAGYIYADTSKPSWIIYAESNDAEVVSKIDEFTEALHKEMLNENEEINSGNDEAETSESEGTDSSDEDGLTDFEEVSEEIERDA